MFKLAAYRKMIVLLAGAALLLTHLWVSYISLHYPYIGIRVAASAEEEGVWRVTGFYPNSKAPELGIAIHDEIFRVDGKPVGEHDSINKFHDLEMAHVITVKRNGVLYSCDFREQHVPITKQRMTLLAAELILFGAAAFLAMKVKKSRAVGYLIATFVTMGIVFMCAEASSKADMLAYFLTNIATSLSPFLFASSIYHFLQEKGHKLFHYRWMKLGQRVHIALIALSAVYFIDGHLYSLFRIVHGITLICFVAGCLLIFVLLLSVYKNSRLEYSFSSMIVKKVFQVFIVSFVPFLLLSVVPDLFGSPIIQYTDTIWFVILFPVSIICFAIQYKLFRNRGILRSLFGGHSRQLISFQRILAEHKRALTLTDIESYLLPRLGPLLGFEALAIRIVDSGTVKLAVYGQMNSQEIEQAVLEGDADSSAYIVYAIHPRYEYTSQLVLKRKPSRQAVNAEMRSCIDVLIAWLALTLENIYLSGKLSMKVEELITESAATSEMSGERYLWFRNTLYQMQEKERRRIASELHDTVMQDIYFARQRIAAIRRDALESEVLDMELQELTDYLDIINMNLRDTNFQLYPHLLNDAGFAETVSNLVEAQRLNVPFQLHLRIEHKAEWDRLDTAAHHHLFRIMQELIANAKKHSDANEVTFHLTKSDQALQLAYADDGIGFDAAARHEGSGLLGIQHRIGSLEGRVRIDTAINKGFKLMIMLPSVGGQHSEAGN